MCNQDSKIGCCRHTLRIWRIPSYLMAVCRLPPNYLGKILLWPHSRHLFPRLPPHLLCHGAAGGVQQNLGVLFSIPRLKIYLNNPRAFFIHSLLEIGSFPKENLCSASSRMNLQQFKIWEMSCLRRCEHDRSEIWWRRPV